MPSQYDDLLRVHDELQNNDTNGTMTKNPGGEPINKNRRELFRSLIERLARKKVSTDPTTGKKAEKATAGKAVKEETESHNDDGIEH